MLIKNKPKNFDIHLKLHPRENPKNMINIKIKLNEL